MATSTTGPGRHLGHGLHAPHLGLLLRILYTSALVLVFAFAIGAVVGLALTKIIDQVVSIL